MLLEPGAITPLDLELAPPQELDAFKSTVDAQIAFMNDRGELLDNEAYILSTLRLKLGHASLAILERLEDVYRDLLIDSDIALDSVSFSVVFGKNTNLSWHPDTPGDIRFLGNLGSDSHVDVAEEWDPTQYRPGKFATASPQRSRRLDVPHGAIYVGNNLVTNEDLLRPHRTPEDAGRLILRASCYAAPGWQNLVVDGGLPVELALPEAA